MKPWVIPFCLTSLKWIMVVLLAGFFLWSGAKKLEDLSAFTESVGNFEFEWEVTWQGETRNFFDPPMDAVIAYTVPWLEIMAALALLVPVTRAAGGVVLLGLLGSFNLALGYARDRGITDLKCGCHGVSGETTDYAAKIGSNFGLMGVIVVIFLLGWGQRRLVRQRKTTNLAP